MSDEPPRLITLSPEALFRARVVALVAFFLEQGLEMNAAVRRVAESPIETHVAGSFRRVSERTTRRWLKAYRDGGREPEALEPKRRSKTGPKALSPEQVDFFVIEKLADPDASVPELIRKAAELGVIASEQSTNRSTVSRALKWRGITTGRGKKAAVPDSRRFAYEHRMDMVLADFKHFRAGPTGRKRLALYFIDDATRFVLGVLVTTKGESAHDVLTLFHQVIARYGRMKRLYVDHGSGFKAKVLEQVCLNFDPTITVIHGKVRYPEGRAKIERFNRSVKARVLRHLRKPGIDPDVGALTLRLLDDIEYHNSKKHEGLKHKRPRDVWDTDSRKLQPVQDEGELRRIFTVALRKPSKVSADHVVRVGGKEYEVPHGYARQWVQIYRRVLEATEERDALYLVHDGVMLRLHTVDPHFNARDKRVQHRPQTESPSSPNTQSAAELSHQRRLGPITDADGSYHDTNKEH